MKATKFNRQVRILCLWIVSQTAAFAAESNSTTTYTQLSETSEEQSVSAIPPEESLRAGVPASISYPSSSPTGTDSVTWGIATNGWTYELQESRNNGVSFTTVTTIEQSQGRAWAPASARANGNYVYRVRACADLCSVYKTGANMTVNIPPPPPPKPTVNLSASPLKISPGSTTTFSWTSVGADSCSLTSFGAVEKNNNAKLSAPISTAQTFTLTCTNAGGSASAAVNITMVPVAPTGISSQMVSQPLWVLIHTDVPFLIKVMSALEGSGTFSWAAVSGATSYRYRVLVNGQWSAWTTVTGTSGSLTGINSGDADIELQACDSSGCSAAASFVVQLSPWQSLGACDPTTDKQKQICVDARYCSLNAQREISGACSQSVKPCSQ